MREEWKEVLLGEILQIERGGSPRPIKDYITTQQDGINWIKIGDTKGITKYITNTYQKIKPSGLKKTRMVYIDDFILSNSMSFGKPYIMKVEGAIHDGWLVLRNTYNVLDKNFLYYSLSSPSVYNQFSKRATGSTVKNLNKELVAGVNIFLPPLPEQRAIVSKIEELFSSLDNGIANLEKAQEQLNVYRQAVLKKAFEGELTKTKMAIKNVGEVTSIVTKGSSPKWQGFDYIHDRSQLLFITSENIREGYISLEKEKYLDLGFNQVQERSILEKGDILFNIVGASIGRAAVFTLDKISNINQAVAIIRLNKEANKEYVCHFLNSSVAKQEYLKKSVEVARANLSLKNVKEIEIPWCNIKEQHQIVQEIESRLSVCDKVEESIIEGLQKAKALKQSILKKAFDGALLSEAELAACRQKADWEPAVVLLEKIKAEKG